MRYIQASGATFIRHVIDNGEPTVWDENHNVRASKLTPEEATTFGVFKLKLVTPPAHNPLTQTRTDGDALLVGGVWTQNWVIANMTADEAATAKAEAAIQVSAAAKARLKELDLKSIRSMREWIAKQTGAPKELKDYETEAIVERAKVK